MKNNLFEVTENEKNRILEMYKFAIKNNYVFENDDPNAQKSNEELFLPHRNDDDYEYKKQGDKYYFKLRPDARSPKAINFKNSGKYLNWTEAKGRGLDAIKKLDWSKAKPKMEKLKIIPVSGLTVTSQSQGQTQNLQGQTQNLQGQTQNLTLDNPSLEFSNKKDVRQDFRQQQQQNRQQKREQKRNQREIENEIKKYQDMVNLMQKKNYTQDQIKPYLDYITKLQGQI